MNDLPSPASLLKKYQIKPKKRLGQHFLTAPPTIDKIIASANPKKNDRFIEIGSGLGVMTAKLAEQCQHVSAIEYDRELFEIARAEFHSIKNISWINADILSFDIAAIAGAPLQIIGNLPYEITTPILFWLLAERASLKRATLMMQKEVAMRLVAKPGTKTYGILSVLVQAHASCHRLFDVGMQNFLPPPKVISSVVDLVFDEPYAVQDEGALRRLVHAAFNKRRKTLRNALLASPLGLSSTALDRALQESGIDGSKRAEALSIAEYLRLADVI